MYIENSLFWINTFSLLISGILVAFYLIYAVKQKDNPEHLLNKLNPKRQIIAIVILELLIELNLLNGVINLDKDRIVLYYVLHTYLLCYIKPRYLVKRMVYFYF